MPSPLKPSELYAGMDHELLSQFLVQYYEDNSIPQLILLPLDLPDAGHLEKLLQLRMKEGKRVSSASVSTVRLETPQRGNKRDYVKMADTNARFGLDEMKSQSEDILKTLGLMREKLHLKAIPRRIECFDNSHFQGSAPVASRVCFTDGVPEKKYYRHYKIKNSPKGDDYAFMKEVLTRRFLSHISRSSDDPLPDLILVDGGPGQLGIAVQVMADLKLTGMEIASIAKAKTRPDMQSGTLDKSRERIYLPGRKNPVLLRPDSRVTHLVERIRDEAHRFAITFHRKTREKEALLGGLDEIRGLGRIKKKALLKHFGSVDKIRGADSADIVRVPGIHSELAERILQHLKNGN